MLTMFPEGQLAGWTSEIPGVKVIEVLEVLFYI